MDQKTPEQVFQEISRFLANYQHQSGIRIEFSRGIDRFDNYKTGWVESHPNNTFTVLVLINGGAQDR